MKLEALTICINYSDYLLCILDNARHFDRWVVVTAENDAATIDVCRRNGIEVIRSRSLLADGSDFNPVSHKASAINEGLAALSPDCWALIIDSDILLPRNFRRRVDGLPLESGFLYGVKGRRVCSDFRRLEALRNLEPWQYSIARNSRILGYFQLFDLRGSPNRYPVQERDKAEFHDDLHFAGSFAAERQYLLPMAVIHTGFPYSNWSKRISIEYVQRGRVRSAAEGSFSEMLDSIGGQAVAASIGYFPGDATALLATKTERLYLVDHYRIHQRSSDPLIEADRCALRQLMVESLAGGTNVSFVGPNGAQNLSAIPPASLDLLHVNAVGGLCETLIESLDLWLSKLKERAIICGHAATHTHTEGIYDIAAIASLLGNPDFIDEGGFWWKRISPETGKRFAPRNGANGHETKGVAIVNTDCANLEKALVSIDSIRAYWDGPLALYHYGKVTDALRIACWKAGCDLHQVSHPPYSEFPGDSDLRSAPFSPPFDSTVVVESGVVAIKPLETLFITSPAATVASSMPRLQLITDTARVPLNGKQIALATENDWHPSAVFGVFAADSAEWTEHAWERWTEAKSAMLGRHPVAVRVSSGATIVIVANRDGLGELQHHWPAMRFPDETPVQLYLLDVSEEEAWLPGDSQPEIRHFSASLAASDLLRAIYSHCATETIVFLPTFASALPCAELFADAHWQAHKIIMHTWGRASDELSITKNVFVSAEFFGSIDRQLLKALLEQNHPRLLASPNIPIFMYVAMTLHQNDTDIVDLSDSGWLILPRCQYVRREFQENHS